MNSSSPENRKGIKQGPRTHLARMLDEIEAAGDIDQLRTFLTTSSRAQKKIDVRTFDALLKSAKAGQEVRRARNTVEAIESFYFDHYGDGLLYNQLRKKISKKLQDSQAHVSEYLGQYEVFYRSYADCGFSRGTMEFLHVKNRFEYKSEIEIKKKRVTHTGFVFHMGDRLYLTGLGSDFTRPMLFKTLAKDQSLKHNHLNGIVLSISASDPEHEIFARNVVMIHREHSRFNFFNEPEIRELLQLPTIGSGIVRLFSPEEKARRESGG